MTGKYFYIITPSDLYYDEGDPLPEIGSVLSFVKEPKYAYAQLVNRGFMIPFDHDIFIDDGIRFKTAEFQTGLPGIPNVLTSLTDGINPYSKMIVFNQMDIGKMKFQKLIVNRYVEPSMNYQTGGKYKKRMTRRSRKVRKSRRFI